MVRTRAPSSGERKARWPEYFPPSSTWYSTVEKGPGWSESTARTAEKTVEPTTASSERLRR